MPNSTLGRILIVDDEAAQMKALCDTLRDQGYETVGFTSAMPALAEYQQRPFDLVLTDLMMAGVDGIGLLRAAKDIDSQVVGIVMTGHGTIDTAVEAMKAGALDYILKPFKLSVILPVLSRALTVRRLRLENEELNRRVREHALRLEEANKELENFASSVSHDLYAPARRINLHVSSLIKSYAETLDPDAQERLQSIERISERMGQMIADMLSFARLARAEMQLQPVDLNALIAQVVRELQSETKDRDIIWNIAEFPMIRGDKSILRQAILNLLSNALKFTRHREQASIEIGRQATPEELVCFVRDNGAGFDMRHASKLFGVFQRLHRSEEFEGTGVGLSTVQRIIQRHGGRIWAEADLDKGATFYFTLPLMHPDSQPP